LQLLSWCALSTTVAQLLEMTKVFGSGIPVANEQVSMGSALWALLTTSLGLIAIFSRDKTGLLCVSKLHSIILIIYREENVQTCF